MGVTCVDPEEIPLPPGRLTAGVVRVGETVRRPRKASSPFVACVLAHLEAAGCTWAPRHLGVDEATPLRRNLAGVKREDVATARTR